MLITLCGGENVSSGFIYRKSDGRIVASFGPGQLFRGLEVETARNVIPNYGGQLTDYAWADVEDSEFARLAGMVNLRVERGRVLGDSPPDPQPPARPEEPLAERIAALEARLAALEARLVEQR